MNNKNQDWNSFIQEALDKYGSNFGVIYRIFCEKTGVSYVGQTTALNDLILSNKRKRKKTATGKPTRILSHYNALKKGIHPHRKLQESWNTSSETFCDEPLEIVGIDPTRLSGKKALNEREKYWQSQFNATETKLKTDQLHYKLSPDTLRQLKQAGAINNQTLIFFILKLQNPWCDRPLKIDPLQIAIEWDLPESSVYEAILKLKNQGLISIIQATMTLRWTDPEVQEPEVQEPEVQEPEQNRSSNNPEPILISKNEFRDVRMNSEMSEPILISQNEFRDVRMNSEMSENHRPKPSPSKDSSSPQTIQTYTDFIQTLSEGERVDFENFCRRETDNYPRPIINLKDYLNSKDSNGQTRYLDFWERFSAGDAPRTNTFDKEEAWNEALKWAARYNRYDQTTWLNSLPISSRIKNAIEACGGLMKIGEASPPQLRALKSMFKQRFQ